MDIKSVVKKIKADIKERFTTYETAAGGYFMFVGAVLFIDIRAWSTLLPMTFFLFGLRLFIVNRIKQKAKENKEIANHEV